MKEVYYFASPLGFISVETENNFITALEFCDKYVESIGCAVALEAERQITEYFEGLRTAFDLPLKPRGSEFQKKVWYELKKIPYGETVSYKDIACRIGNEKACRAVGMANNKNPIPIIIPCHRVIGSNHKLVGYAYGLETKEFLLDLEHNVSSRKE